METRPNDITPEEQPDLAPETPGATSLARTFGGQSIVRDVVETLLLVLIIFIVVNTLTGRYQVRGASMEPSLQTGQYLIVSKVRYQLGAPQRGDVVVFTPPNGAHEDYVKRIIGLPGELVEARDGAIWIDGWRLDEPYTSGPIAYFGSWQLGPDEYFVLGDNRSNSSDSHNWGPLPVENIVGKAWVCYWPPQLWSVVTHHHFPAPPTHD